MSSIHYKDENNKIEEYFVGGELTVKYGVSYGDEIKVKDATGFVIGYRQPPHFLYYQTAAGKLLHTRQKPTCISENTPRTNKRPLSLTEFSGKNVFNDKTLSDVEIHVGGSVFYLHKIILSMRCDKFNAMFTSQCTEAQTGTVKIKDVDETAFGIMLQYIYEDKVELASFPIQVIIHLATLAHEYFLPSLVSTCNTFLITQLTVENVCDVQAYANLHECHGVKVKCLNFISKNIAALKKVLLTSSPNLLVELIEHQNIYLQNSHVIDSEDFETRNFQLFGAHWNTFIDYVEEDDEEVEYQIIDISSVQPTNHITYEIFKHLPIPGKVVAGIGSSRDTHSWRVRKDADIYISQIRKN